MNVDVDNFSEIRDLILTNRLIEKSQLISFDLEFAGLKFEGNDKDRPQYLPSEKYQKMSAVARKYCIMQVGITFFVPSQKGENATTAYPFNFYIFPRPTIYGDPTVSLQSGCVSFNIANKMDWNRWIGKGITYMKLTQYERITDILEKARKFDELFDFLEDQNKMVIKDIIHQIQTHEKKSTELDKDLSQKSFQLPASSFVFTKKVIEKYFQENGKLYAVKQKKEVNKEQETIQFQVIMITKEEKRKMDNKKQQQLYGFTLLFQKIWNSGKTFVGHNFFFDLLFMYDAFIAPLPYDYQLFKKFITEVKEADSESQKLKTEKIQNQSLRRTFYDTKFISNNLNYMFDYFEDSTSLQGIYRTINERGLVKKQLILPKEYERYDLKNQVLHEAGFDSYLTGWIYYQMVELAKIDKLNIQDEYRGKINLNRSYFYMDIQSPFDGVCEHEKVFYIEAVDPKKFIAIDYLKKQRLDVFKNLREILKDENLIKDVIIREGLKEVFIEIRGKTNHKKVISLLVKYVKQKKIKDLYSLSRFLATKNAKEWTESFTKNGNNLPVA